MMEELAVPAVEARNLVKTYPGDVRALEGLSFAIESGTVFGLLGPNGAGESTTVKILTTLSRPTSGSAQVAGHEITRHPDRVRRAIGSVSQHSAVDPEATGRENMVLQGRMCGMRGVELSKRVDELLDRFSLADAADRVVRTYSGGIQRKLDVAIGLVHRPCVLFLDEPTTGLDPEARAELWEEIGRLTREDGLTILMTTHYLEEADRLARRLAIVDRGRIVAEGTPDELKSELRGDTVQVELLESTNGAATAALSHLAGVSELAIDGRLLRARVDNGAAAIPSLITTLERAGLRVASATIARPTLDDVYLRHAGRSFQQADTNNTKE